MRLPIKTLFFLYLCLFTLCTQSTFAQDTPIRNFDPIVTTFNSLTFSKDGSKIMKRYNGGACCGKLIEP